MKRLAAVAAAALILVGCGSSTDTSSDPSEPDTPQTTDSDEDELIDAVQRGEQRRVECRRQVGPLLRKLNDIDSRLNIGLNQSDYNTALGDASVAYDAIPIGRLSPKCTSTVAVPLENAFNQYIKANDAWSDCIDDLYCDIETDTLPGLRQRWSNASQQIAKAERVLSDLSWY